MESDCRHRTQVPPLYLSGAEKIGGFIDRLHGDLYKIREEPGPGFQDSKFYSIGIFIGDIVKDFPTKSDPYIWED
ncbi:hypothetical protein BGX26_011627, partial [Mortierella sp. AD094]